MNRMERSISASRRRTWQFGILALVGLATGCESLIDAPFDEARPRSAAGPMCESAQPLPPPGVLAAPGDLEITVVVSQLDVAEGVAPDGTPAYLHLGFDVDNTCTNVGVPPRCTTPQWTGSDPTDGPGGVDNGVGHMLFLQPQIFPIGLVTSTLLNDQMRLGELAPPLIVRITDYNGVLADQQVTVELFVPHSPKDVPEALRVPRFDGSDVWPVISEYVEDPLAAEVRAKLTVADAYVTRSELIAHVGSGSVSFLNRPIRFLSAILSGKLELDPISQQWRLTNGVFAGLARSDELLAAIPQGAFETLAIRICTNDGNYAAVKQLICSGSDATDATTGDPSRPCDLTSFALGLQTVPVQIGRVLPAPTPAVVCDPAFDPGTDTCARAP